MSNLIQYTKNFSREKVSQSDMNKLSELIKKYEK